MSHADRHNDMNLGCATERDPYRVRNAPLAPDDGYVQTFADEFEG